MNWWRRVFGLDPVDLAIHATVTGLAAGVMGEASGNDALIIKLLYQNSLRYSFFCGQ